MGWMIAYYYFLPLAGCDVFGRNGRHTRISMTSMHHPLHDQFEFGASESAAAKKLTTTMIFSYIFCRFGPGIT